MGFAGFNTISGAQSHSLKKSDDRHGDALVVFRTVGLSKNISTERGVRRTNNNMMFSGI